MASPLYMDIFGHRETTTLRDKIYVFIILDDYSRYSWASLFSSKTKLFFSSLNFARNSKMREGSLFSKLEVIMVELENKGSKHFVNKTVLNMNSFVPRTSQQMGLLK